MSGALDSGMDIVVELSAQYLERVVRRRYDQEKVCITGTLRNVPVRQVIPIIETVELQQTDGAVELVLRMRVVYGYGQLHLDGPDDESWSDLAGTPNEYRIPLSTTRDGTSVSLTFDVSSLADTVELGADAEGRLHAPIPLDFLSQTRDDTVVLAGDINLSLLKLVDNDTLAIGLGVELSRDPEWHAFGGLGEDEEDILGICGLPDQPQTDAEHFADEFMDDCVGGWDWGIALDGHVVDALLRATDINRSGEEVGDCEQQGARRSFCLRLNELQEGMILIRGHGEAFFCPEQEFLPNAFYEIAFLGMLQLTMAGERTRTLAGRCELTDVWLTGADVDLQNCVDVADGNLLSLLSEEERVIEIPVAGMATVIGEEEDLAGQLRLSGVGHHPNALVLYGYGSIFLPGAGPVLSAPETVLFATGCDGGAEQFFDQVFSIQNRGGGWLHVFPLALLDIPADQPDSEFSHAELFSIESPDSLREGGEGVTLGGWESVSVRLRLTADPGQRYTALLEIPNSAERCTVKLIADLRPAEIRLESNELRLERTVYTGCGQRRPARRILRSLEVANEGPGNEGPGNLQVCEIEFTENPDNADGGPAFLRGPGAYPRVVAAGETTDIAVYYNPADGDIGRTIEGTMRLLTNAGDQNVSLVGSFQHSFDIREGGLFGNFDASIVCGDADWDMIRASGGRIMDVQLVDEVLSVLGGADCCPPPHGPACLCLDLWEISFLNVPRGIVLEVVGGTGEVIATNQARFPARNLFVPIQEGNPYSLRARFPTTVAAHGTSRLRMRRWLLQQDGLYRSSQHLGDLAIAGAYCYAAGPSSMEVISLHSPESPKRVTQVSGLAGAGSLAVAGGHLLAAGAGLKVYSLANPLQPVAVGGLALDSAISALHAPHDSTWPIGIACTVGQRLYTLDLSDPAKPREVGKVSTQVHANRALVKGSYIFLFGKEGVEVYNWSKPEQPEEVGFLATQREVCNARIAGGFALLVHDSQSIGLLDVSKPDHLKLAGGWRLEDWMAEFVPLAGNAVRYKGHFLMLRGDSLGFRVMRARRGRVDLEKLRQRRGQT